MAAGRKRDPVWEYFNEAPSPIGKAGMRAKCKRCNKEMQGLVARMRQHHEKCGDEDDQRNTSEQAGSSGEFMDSGNYPPPRSPSSCSTVSELSIQDSASLAAASSSDTHSHRSPSPKRKKKPLPPGTTTTRSSGRKRSIFSNMDFLDRNINLDALLKFSHISHSTQQHLKRVYSSFALCMLVAAAGAYANVVFGFLQGNFLTFAGTLGTMLWLMFTPHSYENEKKRLGILAAFAFFSGCGLGPILNLCIAVNPSIIPTAFLGTAAIFTCFTLSALYSRSRTFLFLGGILMSGLSLLTISSLLNIFIGSVFLFKMHMYVGLLVMCGFVLFDTQLIIDKAEKGDKDYVWHCVDLFLDFITIFRKLMIILAMNEKDKKKERK